MKVLCTGAAGFIGSHVVDALQGAGHDVFGIDDFSTGRAENLQAHKYKGASKFQNGSILNCEMLESNFGEFKPDAVVHLAAQAAISTSIQNPSFDLTVNGQGTLNVLRAAIDYHVNRFVLASTSAVYSHSGFQRTHGIYEVDDMGPDTPYGISKLAAEGYTRTLFKNSVILRFGNVYGPRQVPIGENQVISRMIRHMKYGDEFYIHGSGNQRRDFVYVTDVAWAVLAALGGHAGTYNIATGETTSVNALAKIIESYYGVKGYSWDHTDKEDARKSVKLNIEHAQRDLKWKPGVKILQGINSTIEWWESLPK